MRGRRGRVAPQHGGAESEPPLPAQELLPAAPPSLIGPPPEHHAGGPRLATADGLVVELDEEGGIERLEVGGVEARPWLRLAPGRPPSPAAGFAVGDFGARGPRAVRGALRAEGNAFVMESPPGDDALSLEARWEAHGDRIEVRGVLRDHRGDDRAVDLWLLVPLPLAGGRWHEDLLASRELTGAAASALYPWATATTREGPGLTLAIPPDAPCAWSFGAEPRDDVVSAHLRLGLSPRTRAPGTAAFALTLYRTDAAWGFREALARYYRIHPEPFRPRLDDWGGWLFAFPPERLPNPEDYAFYEVPAGGRAENLGGRLVTAVYRIPPQRQLVLPWLPQSERAAEAAAEEALDSPDPATRLIAELIRSSAVWNASGRPYIVRRSHLGEDVRPDTPTHNIVFSVNPDPDLFAGARVPTVGAYELEQIAELLRRDPAPGGVYLDSLQSWVSPKLNFREEHFPAMDTPLSYDPESGRVCAPGWQHLWEFMAELRRRLPADKVIMSNLGRGRLFPFLAFATDVCGLESALRRGEPDPTLGFYRAVAGRKPLLVLEYLEVNGTPTRWATREGFEELWSWSALYGAYPSIGRFCDEAWDRFGEVYRRYREPLHRIAAAGWEPVTSARFDDPRLRIERFGDVRRGLYFTVLNTGGAPLEERPALELEALDLAGECSLRDLLSGEDFGTRQRMAFAPGQVRILECRPSP